MCICASFRVYIFRLYLWDIKWRFDKYTLQSLLINGGTSNSARVDASNNDIIVNNGVIQPIDAVLIPPVLPTAPPTTTPPPLPTLTIFQTLLRDDTRFLDVTLALLLADLAQILDGRDILIVNLLYKVRKILTIL